MTITPTQYQQILGSVTLLIGEGRDLRPGDVMALMRGIDAEIRIHNPEIKDRLPVIVIKDSGNAAGTIAAAFLASLTDFYLSQFESTGGIAIS